MELPAGADVAVELRQKGNIGLWRVRRNGEMSVPEGLPERPVCGTFCSGAKAFLASTCQVSCRISSQPLSGTRYKTDCQIVCQPGCQTLSAESVPGRLSAENSFRGAFREVRPYLTWAVSWGCQLARFKCPFSAGPRESSRLGLSPDLGLRATARRDAQCLQG